VPRRRIELRPGELLVRTRLDRAHHSQWERTGPNRCSKATRGSAPTTRSTSFPSRITTSSGIDCAPNLVASPGFASTSTFTTLRCPACRSARSSSTGEIIRHGPHHAAQKSTTTGTEAVVSATNVSPSASTTQGSVDLHRGHRGIPRAIGPTRLRALQVGQPMIVTITRLEPGAAVVALRPDQPSEGASGRVPAATLSTSSNC
jgi:hypothetical protein